MKEINFEPYVGKDYYDNDFLGKKQRIMILGESHYDNTGELQLEFVEDKERFKTFTSDIVQKYLSYRREQAEYESWMQTFMKFEKSLVGRETNVEDSQKIWNSVLFYNYLQVFKVRPQSNERADGNNNDTNSKYVTNEDYIEAGYAFFKVLKQYKPDLIITWGKGLYGKMPGNKWKGINELWPELTRIWKDGIDGKNDYNVCGMYTPDDVRVQVLAVRHPSCWGRYKFDWNETYDIIRPFLN